MTAPHHRSFYAEFLRRVTAGGCAALMLLLTALAASPDLHERFHGTDKVRSEDGCAVVLFANGVSLATTAIVVPAPQNTWSECSLLPRAEIFLVTSRYLRQPERGPPLS